MSLYTTLKSVVVNRNGANLHPKIGYQFNYTTAEATSLLTSVAIRAPVTGDPYDPASVGVFASVDPTVTTGGFSGVVGNRTGAEYTQGAPTGTSDSGLGSFRFMLSQQVRDVGPVDLTDVQFAFANWFCVPGEGLSGNAVTYGMTITDSDGQRWQITFEGAKKVTVQPGETVWSDKCSVLLKANTQYLIQPGVAAVDNTGYYVSNFALQNHALEGWWNVGADVSQMTWPDVAVELDNPQSGGSGLASLPGLPVASPCGMRGVSSKAVPKIIVITDSIGYGIGETDPSSLYVGWVKRNLQANYHQQLFDAAGDTLNLFLTAGPLRGRLMADSNATNALVQIGTNDLPLSGAYDTCKARYVLLYQRLRARGVKSITQATILPRTTSTDNWATLVNQTPFLNSVQEAIRVQLNEWFRAGADGLINHCADVAALGESSRNSGLWRVDLGQPAVDGLHPSTVMATHLSTVDTSTFFTV